MLNTIHLDIWQDREIRFDVSNIIATIKNGEKLIQKIECTEDVKGNNGDKGNLMITNLRVLWISKNLWRNNLSIGFSCFMNISTRILNLKNNQKREALVILSKYSGTRFEFIFASHMRDQDLHKSVADIYKCYESTRLYRDLKLRGAFMKDNTLLLLAEEKLYAEVDGVWNLSSSQLHITSRKSKFGEALVIQTTKHSGSYSLGFRIDPPERLASTIKQLISLHHIYFKNPILEVQNKPVSEVIDILDVDNQQDINQTIDDHSDLLTVYLSDENKICDAEPVYNEELGLAIEKLPDKYKIADLWAIFSTNDDKLNKIEITNNH